MISSLMSLRLASRKRPSASLEEDSAASTATASVNNSPQRDVKPMPSPPSSRKKPRSKSMSRTRTPAPEPIPDPPEVVALNALKKALSACPPKYLQSTILSRLDSATPEQVSVFASVLIDLNPPPTLHCARCHSDYLEEENYERSCVMDHDDNSTSVKYGETLWGCCGSTSEGQEPPVGWCYEGRHTDDRSKARYRQDFEDDEDDDGLQSCKQKRCKRRVEDTPEEPHVIVTRHRGERPPPSKKKKIV